MVSNPVQTTVKEYKIRVAPEYILEDETGSFCSCDECGVRINDRTDLCNKCYGVENLLG